MGSDHSRASTRRTSPARLVALAVALALGLARAGEAAGQPTSITVEPGAVILPTGARTQLGFQFGPVDGVMGS